MPIKRFRGLIADGAVQNISLHTNDGSVGYKIVKFELMGNKPGDTSYESVVKIYKIPQTEASVDAVIDFSDNTMIAAGFLEGSTSVTAVDGKIVIFDNEIFNQDIYITHKNILNVGVDDPVNYYIELEQIKLDLTDNTMATLKDIKNIEASYL